MIKFDCYLLNKKGYSVLKAFHDMDCGHLVSRVCIGQDSALVDDYSKQIASLASAMGLEIFERGGEPIPTEVALAAGWRWLIKDAPGLIVIHDSLLPAYRGFAPLVNMLIEGESRIGATMIWAQDGYDKGPVIRQGAVSVDHPVFVKDAIDLVCEVYAELIKELCKDVERGCIPKGEPQKEEEASYSLWRDEEDYYIDWTDSAERILRFIYAVGFPYEGAVAQYGGGEIRVLDAEVCSDLTIVNRQPGKVIFMTSGMPTVVCGVGLLKLTKMEKNGEPYKMNKFRIRFR